MIDIPKFQICLLFVTTVYCAYVSNVIDVDDILSEDFMPGTLLVLENPTNGVNTFNKSIKNVEEMEKVPDGSFNNAMETMNFHRSMMNQYMCRNFVAEQIINDMTTSRINRRMGHVTPGSEPNPKDPSKFKSAAQNNLLHDEGSSNYKDWLSKSTTLEDIYRHYDQAQNRVDGDVIEEEDKGEDFDEEYNGHLTGFVQPHDHQTPVKHRGHTGLGTYYTGGNYQGGGYPYTNAVYNHGGGGGYQHGGGGGYQHGGGSSGYHYNSGSGGHHGGGYQTGGGGGYSHDGTYGDEDYSHHGGSGGGHSAYGGDHHVVETIYQSGPPKYQVQHEASYGGKEHDLSDLFDIALTALAFLSFGLFIVHVIMCISAANYNSTTTVASMMPMSLSPTATATGTGTGTATGNNGGGGGSTTSTGGGSTGGGTTSTGTGGGSPGTGMGAGMTATGTGGGSAGTGMGAGMTATGEGSTGMGDDGTEPTGMGGDSPAGTGTGAGMTATGGGSTSTGDDGTEPTGTGGGATGGGDIDEGGGGTSTGNGGGAGSGDTTGSTSPGTGTGTGGGTTGSDTGGGATAMGTGTGSGKDILNFRVRRDIPTITNPNHQALNELARRVLTSIEAALVANSDNGVCLRKSLCENNKYSRNLESKDKLIVPMWSLGMSWLAGRLVKSVPPATSMLDTLKASILGLGMANCEIIYQDCNLRRERRKRRRRRRKRAAI